MKIMFNMQISNWHWSVSTLPNENESKERQTTQKTITLKSADYVVLLQLSDDCFIIGWDFEAKHVD